LYESDAAWAILKIPEINNSSSNTNKSEIEHPKSEITLTFALHLTLFAAVSMIL
jgi:hypothetical protein